MNTAIVGAHSIGARVGFLPLDHHDRVPLPATDADLVVSKFEIFAAVRQRASRLRFPERRPASQAVVSLRKAAPRTRYGPFQDVPGRVDVAVDLHLAMRASVDTDRKILLDRAAALRAFLRGVPRVDDREPATGPFSLVAQHRDHHARRNLEDLPVEPGLLPDVFAWTFDRALGRAGQPLHL